MRCVIIELFDSLKLRQQSCALSVTCVRKTKMCHSDTCCTFVRSTDARVVWMEASHHRPKQFRFLDFRVEMLFHSIILCFVLSIYTIFFLLFLRLLYHSQTFWASYECRSLCFHLDFFFVWFCLSCSSFSFVYFFIRCSFGNWTLCKSKWFFLMKLELRFHLAIRSFVRSFVQLYERFGRFLFCETLLDHEWMTCTQHHRSQDRSNATHACTHRQLELNGPYRVREQ